MKRKSGMLSVFALALFMMSIFLPISNSIGIITDIQNIDSMDQPSQVASETGLDGRNSPMSMLVYTEFISEAGGSSNEFRNTIESIEDTYGYWFNYDNLTDYTELESRIWAYDVFLITEQELIYDENATDIAAAWNPFITDWVTEGGIIIMMDYAGGEPALVPIYNETGLMNIEGYTDLTAASIGHISDADALARGVEATTFSCPDGSFGYNTTGTTAAFGSGDFDWTAHKIMGAGHVVLLGFDNYERHPVSDIVLANALRLHQHAVIDNSHSPGLNPYTGNINFTNDLLSAGFAVTIMDTWSELVIESADVLIIQYCYTAYNASEIDFIEDWVSAGGGLFVLSEYGPLGNNMDLLTDRFGFMRNTSALISDSDDWEDYDRYVYYESANIENHSVSLWCNRIELAGSGAFDSIPDNAVPIIVSDTDGTAGWWNTTTSFIFAGVWNGSISAAVAPYGMGRVSVILDTAIIDNIHDYNSDGLEDYFEYSNDVFAVNNVRWLFAAGIEEKTVLFEESNSPLDYANGWYHDFALMLTLNGFTVKWESVFHETLINEADVIFIADGAFNYTTTEVEVLYDYVVDGGSLFLLGDTTILSDYIDDIANEFGLAYNNTAGNIEESDDFDTNPAYLVYNQSNFATHPIMEGVTRMEFDLCTAFQSIGSATALAWADDDGTATWSGPGTIVDGLAIAAATTEGKGRVVAITDINLPMVNYDFEGDGYGNMLDSDNDVFLANAFLWLTANRAPVVEVLSPNGGEIVDGTITVNWTASDLDDDPLTYDVYYSDNNGSDWTLLANGLVVMEYSWNTLLHDDGNSYMIRVEVFDGVLSAQDESDDPFEIDNPYTPTVEVTYPNGGEIFEGTITVNWTAFDVDDGPLTYDVYYSDNNGSDWTLLANDLVVMEYAWNTALHDDGNSYMIRVNVSDGVLSAQDESDDPFEVDNPHAPTVEVTYPNGGEVLNGTETITWTAHDLDGDSMTYDVYYSDNNGADWTLLASDLTVTHFTWNTTAHDDGSLYLIRVEVSDGVLSSFDASDNPFELDNFAGGTGIDPGLITIIIIIVGAAGVVIIIIIIIKKKK